MQHDGPYKPDSLDWRLVAVQVRTGVPIATVLPSVIGSAASRSEKSLIRATGIYFGDMAERLVRFPHKKEYIGSNPIITTRQCAISSEAERLIYIQRVGVSKSSSRTKFMWQGKQTENGQLALYQ